MPEFLFEARDRQGASQTGTLAAVDASALADMLRQRGWLVTNVRVAPGSSAPGSGAHGSGAHGRATGGTSDASLVAKLTPGYWLPPRSIDIEVALQQLSTMLRSGLTLLSALDSVVKQSQRRSMRDVWRRISERIQEGSGFGDAMAEHSCFSRLVIQLVRVGEQTGSLDAVLTRAADGLEARRILRTNLITAMIYPIIVVVMAVGVSAFMVLSVIPKVEQALAGLGRRLPAMTQSLMDLSAWINAYLPGILVGIGVCTVALIATYLWPPGRMWLDRLALRVPVIGRLLRLAGTAAFAHTMGILIRSGVTVLEGLRTTHELHRNHYLASRVDAARRRVLEGGSLAEPLGHGRGYMPMLASMVGVGESAGTLDDALDEVAAFHEKQLQSAIKRFSAIIEPIIIVVVGGIVGFVYISFFLALFSFAGGVG